MAEPIFHLALLADWQAAQLVGEYRVSTLGSTLEQVGYLHCSRADQVEGVMRAFYADVTEPMVLLRIQPDLLTAPVVDEEGSPGGPLFPHLYGPLETSAVVRVDRVVEVAELAALTSR